MAGHNQSGWTFLSNHSHVLVCLWRNPDLRMRELAQEVGVTERAVQRIVGDLAAVGAVHVQKEGRANRYEVNLEFPLRHPLESHATIGDLVRAVAAPRCDLPVADAKARSIAS